MMSIQVENTTKMYGEQKALNNVSFNINKGEIVGLLGPNGAGKSTMMKIITCYIPQSSGEVKVCGYDVVEDSLEVRKKVGYLPETNPLYPDMYIREYLEYVGGLQGIRKGLKERVEDMIQMTGLGSEAHKKIGALSKGYKQRVGLAQAMIHSPEILILDEPTSGLDPNQLVEIRALIKTLGKEKTVVLSTHIMQEVEAMCDRVIIIDKGNIVADGPTHQLDDMAGNHKLLHIEFDKQPPLRDIASLPGVIEVIDKGNYCFHVICDAKGDLRPEIFHFAVNHQLAVLSMNYVEQSLEDVFRKLTTQKKG